MDRKNSRGKVELDSEEVEIDSDETYLDKAIALVDIARESNTIAQSLNPKLSSAYTASSILDSPVEHEGTESRALNGNVINSDTMTSTDPVSTPEIATSGSTKGESDLRKSTVREPKNGQGGRRITVLENSEELWYVTTSEDLDRILALVMSE